MDPITDQDLPQDGIIENDDGSVDIIDDSMAVYDGSFQDNLAELLDEQFLTTLGNDLYDDIERDMDARKKRDKQYEDGLRRTGMGDDAPGGAEFEGASDVVHPVLAEACVDFAARAIKELFPPQGPVKTATVGSLTDVQLDRAERKRTFMNWQLTTQMPEYRSELEQLLTQLPLGGSQFQKFKYDARFDRPDSEFVPIDDIHIPYSAKSFYTAARVTHVQHITRQEFKQRVKSGLYRDLNLNDVDVLPDQTDSARANDKIEGKEEEAYNEDGLRDVYEVYTWEELTGDELANDLAPYIITIDAYTQRVLSVYRNWAEGDESLEKLDWIVEWKFIPWRGAYAIGFPQLIGSLSAAATGALRALLDSAHINNLPGLIKLKSNATTGQNVAVRATGITEISGPAGLDDIRKLLMPMPFNAPSPILFQLLGWLTEAAKGVVRTAEGAIANIGDRTPVGTTQAVIEQGSTIYSAIHARLHESQKRALQIIHRINGTWLDEEQEVEDLGKLIIRREDFVGSLDVIPVSDPSIFSEAQRYAQNQALSQMQAQDAQDPSVPWNKIAIRRRMLKQMRIDNIDEILPAAQKPVTADPMTEIVAAMGGKMILAVQNQDHMAHIQAHLLYLASPVVLDNPLVQGQPLAAVLAHVQQHIMLLEQGVIMQRAQVILQNAATQSMQITPDAAVMTAIGQTAQALVDRLRASMQIIAELQPKIQAKMPPPQMPPEVQASIEIAKMDINRKAQLDKATLEFKSTQEQAKQSLAQAELRLEGMQNQFNQYIEQQRLAMEDRTNQLAVQIETMNNRADNEQKQMTELLKNRDDNETKLKIALQEGFQSLQQQMQVPTEPAPAATADLSPHVEKMQSLLDQIGQSKNNDALATVMQGLQATIQTLQQPRRTTLERDAQGKPVGAVSTIEG